MASSTSASAGSRSAAAAALASVTTCRISVVNLDGLVVLKIIKHCREGLPTFVAGSLLGLDVDEALEVTNCFPFPSTSEEQGDGMAGEDYHMAMLKSLEDMNVDNNQVGWYQSTYLGTVCTTDLVSKQFDFQEVVGPNSVVLVYDPLRTTHGSMPLRAFRLTDAFMKAYRAKKFPLQESLEGAPLASSGIFDEIPVCLYNSPLARGLLYDFQETGDIVDCDFDRLDLTSNPQLEKKMQILIEQVDDLAGWHKDANYWERKLSQQKQAQEAWVAKRKAENAARKEAGQDLLPEKDPKNPIFKPLDAKHVDRLDALMIAGRIGSYCDEINAFAGQNFSKLFLASSLRKPLVAAAAGAGAGAGAAY